MARRRKSTSLYYKPGDSYSRVVSEQRTQFLIFVCNREPDILRRFAEEISPRLGRVWPFPTNLEMTRLGIVRLERFKFTLETLEIAEKRIAQRNRQRNHPSYDILIKIWTPEKVAELQKELESIVENICRFIPFGSPNKFEAVKTLSDYYFSTCLHKLGPWSLGQLLRFDGLIKRANVNFECYPEALTLIHYGFDYDWANRNNDIVVEFNFRVLSNKDWCWRLADLEPYKDIPLADAPLWVFDDAANEYITFQFPPDVESAAALANRVDECYKDAFHHYLQRRDQLAKENNFESFAGKRGQSDTTSENHHHYSWLYQYLVKGLPYEKIYEEVDEFETPEGKNERLLNLQKNSIETAIRRTADLLGIKLSENQEEYKGNF